MRDNFNTKAWLILLAITSLLASILTLVSLPEWVFHFRPDWLILIVVFWIIRLPEKVSLGYACFHGVLLDLLLVKPLGVNAIPFVLLAFVAGVWSSQIKVLSLWQQSLFISVLVLIFKLLVGITSIMSTDFVFTQYYWFSLVGNIVFWPVISIILFEVCRLSEINLKS